MKVESPLSQLNLTHLRALDALLAERSVTRAARQLGLTQSAVSHALRGLRDLMGDELLVRGRGGMVPTARAEALAAPLHRALRDLEAALDTGPTFDPAVSRRTFHLSMGDAFSLVVLPPLLRIVRDEAPHVDLDIRQPDLSNPWHRLETGEIDLAFGVDLPKGPGLHTRVLADERFSCLVRNDHPGVGDTLDLDTYCALPHALMSPSGSGPGVVDRALAKVGRTRRVAFRIAYFLAAPLVVASSDLVLTGPRGQLAILAPMAQLRLLEPPIVLPTFQVRMVWHERVHNDPGHQWLRQAIARIRR